MTEEFVVNPFKPTAGAEPPVLAGREKVIQDFSDGLAEGPGAPGRLMRISGPRGSGKTVLLAKFGEIARKEGWLVVNATAGGGLRTLSLLAFPVRYPTRAYSPTILDRFWMWR